MKAATKRPTKLPAHVQHLHGTHYLVQLDALQVADVAEEGDELGFTNPRHAVFNHQGEIEMSSGFGKQEVDELHAAICSEGMQNPLICRWFDGNGPMVQIVDGERRFRVLQKAILQGDSVYDGEFNSMLPASEVYEWVHCTIQAMNNERANQYAFSMNDRAMTIGDGATAAWVRYLRDKGLDDDKILRMTSKKPSWLKDTDDLATLEPEFWTMLCVGKLNRAAGLKLLKIKGTESRQEALAHGLITAGIRHEKKIAAAEEEFVAAENKEIAVEAEVAETKHTVGAGTSSNTLESAEGIAIQEKAAKAAIAKSAKEQALVSLQQQPPTIEGSDIDPLATPKPPTAAKPLTVARIFKLWEPRCQEIIKESPPGIALADARLVTRLCIGIRAGDEDIDSLLRLHKEANDNENPV